MRIHQFLPGFSYGDAIGNYTLKVREILRRWGFESEIFAEIIHPRLKDEGKYFVEYDDDFKKKDDLIIYHFSIGSVISEFLLETAKKIILIYHNMTPAKYFFGVNDELVNRVVHGYKELNLLKDICIFAIADSEFNRRELISLGYEKTAVLPIPLDFRRLEEEPDPVITELFSDSRINLLFTGRVSPNKRHDELIRIFYTYKRFFDSTSRLIIVGDYRSYMPYYTKLLALIKKFNLDDIVFTGHIDDRELLASYRTADCFICRSEHEGFCVPLLECFYLGIPVVAYNCTAVGETMDGGGLLLNTTNPFEWASAIYEIVYSNEIRDNILKSQQKRIRCYLQFDFEKSLKEMMSKIL